jgi:hypothetical protein
VNLITIRQLKIPASEGLRTFIIVPVKVRHWTEPPVRTSEGGGGLNRETGEGEKIVVRPSPRDSAEGSGKACKTIADQNEQDAIEVARKMVQSQKDII